MLPARQLKKATAIALALSAAVPAAASAKAIGPDPAGASYPPLTTPIVRITIPTSGFDWGDAGIGAAGGLALSMLGVGGALVLTQHRSRHPHSPATPTT